MQSSILAALAFLKVLAARTATTVDDETVELLEAIANSPLLWAWLMGKFADDAAGILSIEAGAPESIVQELRDRKVDWTKLIGQLPTLIALIKALSGK